VVIVSAADHCASDIISTNLNDATGPTRKVKRLCHSHNGRQYGWRVGLTRHFARQGVTANALTQGAVRPMGRHGQHPGRHRSGLAAAGRQRHREGYEEDRPGGATIGSGSRPRPGWGHRTAVISRTAPDRSWGRGNPLRASPTFAFEPVGPTQIVDAAERKMVSEARAQSRERQRRNLPGGGEAVRCQVPAR